MKVIKGDVLAFKKLKRIELFNHKGSSFDRVPGIQFEVISIDNGWDVTGRAFVNMYSSGKYQVGDAERYYGTENQKTLPLHFFIGFKTATNEITPLRDVNTTIYLVKDTHTGFYKIGRSINPEARIKTLRSDKATLEMIYTFEGLRSDETELHKKFSFKRVRGEWFQLDKNDIQSIITYSNNKLKL